MSTKDITIVITSFKSEKKIRRCLNSIDSQCNVINVENSNNQNHKANIEKEFKIEIIIKESLKKSVNFFLDCIKNSKEFDISYFNSCIETNRLTLNLRKDHI